MYYLENPKWAAVEIGGFTRNRVSWRVDNLVAGNVDTFLCRFRTLTSGGYKQEGMPPPAIFPTNEDAQRWFDIQMELELRDHDLQNTTILWRTYPVNRGWIAPRDEEVFGRQEWWYMSARLVIVPRLLTLEDIIDNDNQQLQQGDPIHAAVGGGEGQDRAVEEGWGDQLPGWRLNDLGAVQEVAPNHN